jgi:CRISPR system Cascade subunit CasA
MNLLTEPLIRFETSEGVTRASLPQVYSALVADRIESFPALRPHQVPAWHMFLVQLGVIAMTRAGLTEPPTDAETWLRIIRDLTQKEFPADEPWRLVVDDWAKPAFLQPPVPAGVTLKSEITTPDELDMVITAKNHDLKQAVAANAAPEDWIFSLVSLQTGEGYNGSGNYGIARMNGGSSSRVCFGLAPMPRAASAASEIRPGARLRRDITQLLQRNGAWHERVPSIYRKSGGSALLWTIPWPEGELLPLADLDIGFIEICRRVRLGQTGSRINARAGTSKKRRIDAEQFHGVVGDPWAPAHRTEAKALTLGDSGEFTYSKIVELLSADWELPLLATLGDGETDVAANWQLVAQAFARGNSKTGGFKERVIPLTGRVARSGLRSHRVALHQLATHQIGEIDTVDKILRDAIAIAAAAGEFEKLKEEAYAKSRPARVRLKAEADRLFFPALWERFEAEETGGASLSLPVREKFIRHLVSTAQKLLDEALADLPCPAIHRPRAEARARAQFWSRLRHPKFGFPDIFAKNPETEVAPDAA